MSSRGSNESRTTVAIFYIYSVSNLNSLMYSCARSSICRATEHPSPQSRPSTAILPRYSPQCTSPSCWAWSGCCRSGRPPSLSCPLAGCTWSSRSPGCGSPARTVLCTRSSSRCATCARDRKRQPRALQRTCSRVFDRNKEYMLLNRQFWLCVTLPSVLGLKVTLALLLEGKELSAGLS